MRMLLVGAGAVGESILKVLKKRDPKGEWLEFVLVGDCRPERAGEVAAGLRDTAGRFVPVQVDAFDREGMVKLIRDNAIDFVMDAADPYVSNYIFDAAFAAGARYGNMGTWSVPKENPAFGLGIENSYDEPMTKYNFDRHEAWREAGNMACICLGIDPGAVNVFARYAAEEFFDLLEEVHVKDGGSLSMPQAEEGKIWFGFNVWTVLDEVINLYVEFNSVSDVSRFIAYARSQNCTVRNLEMNRSKNADGSTSVSAVMSLKFEEPVSHAHIIEIYGALDGITFLEEV